MPFIVTESQLIGRRVVSQDGHVLGDVASIAVDTDSWQVVQLGVRLHRRSLERLRLPKPPVLGSHTIAIAIDHVAGVSDTLVLKLRLAELRIPTADETLDDLDTQASPANEADDEEDGPAARLSSRPA